MITTTLDGTYRVSCTELDCPRPLMREVSTSAHAANLERKHVREHHTAADDTDDREHLILLLQSRTFGGRELNGVQAEQIADLILSASFVRPPM